MRLHRIIDKTYAEGPGCRLCVWVQGCSHRCDGCFAEELWDYSGGFECSVPQLTEQLKKVGDSVCGITLLGGEPFDYAEELADFASQAKALGKNVITFTGYTYEYLSQSSIEAYKKLLSFTDILIDGEFDKTKVDYSRPLVGSSNQRFIFLSDEISEDCISNYKNRFEIRADEHGNITFNGMGNIDKLKETLNRIKGV